MTVALCFHYDATNLHRLIYVATIIVLIEFDPVKDAENSRKHGVSLAVAAHLDWDNALVWIDERFEYQELRMIALAPETNTLFYVVFVDWSDVRRIISLRRATRREVTHYVENC